MIYTDLMIYTKSLFEAGKEGKHSNSTSYTIHNVLVLDERAILLPIDYNTENESEIGGGGDGIIQCLLTCL